MTQQLRISDVKDKIAVLMHVTKIRQSLVSQRQTQDPVQQGEVRQFARLPVLLQYSDIHQLAAQNERWMGIFALQAKM